MNDLAPDPAIQRLLRTGFVHPFRWEQVGSWAVYSGELILYFTIIFPTLTPGERAGLTIVWLIIFFGFNFAFLRAELCTHECAFSFSRHSHTPTFRCERCKQQVKLGSKHCGSCNICRLHFDHHCFFLNNCVTDANYYDFFVGVILLTLSAIFLMLLCIWVCMADVYDDVGSADRATEFYGSKVPAAVIYVGCAIIMFIQLGLLVFMGYLLALHFLLAIRGRTTFELIMHRRQLSLERDARRIHS
jgi:hypothetical protein